MGRLGQDVQKFGKCKCLLELGFCKERDQFFDKFNCNIYYIQVSYESQTSKTLILHFESDKSQLPHIWSVAISSSYNLKKHHQNPTDCQVDSFRLGRLKMACNAFRRTVVPS